MPRPDGEPKVRLLTDRLELFPLPPAAAAALPGDRKAAELVVGATFAPEWPAVDLLDVLPLQAAAPEASECFGVWLMVERDTQRVIGDVGFMGPPSEAGTVEIGYSVVPEARRRRYATEAVAALAAWALGQANVTSVVAKCDRENEASIRTLERIGFLRVGEDDNQIHWQVTALNR